jgi:hypothetical protein
VSGELVASVAERVLAPLIAGGPLLPVPPIGEARAIAALEHAAFAGGALNEVRARRLRVARRLTPLDALGDPTPGEWLLLFALNDMLQSTNQTLLGPFGSERPRLLLEMVLSLIARAGAPATVGDALSRHATFSRLLSIVRVDTHVSWWVGSRTFRGMHPPSRLLSWRKVRRVHESEQSVALADMTPATDSAEPLFAEAVRALLAASPLSDLACAGRAAPAFRWTGASLALVTTPGGRTLALRALERARGRKTMLRAIRDLPESIARGATPEAGRVTHAVSELAVELEQRFRLAEPVEAPAAPIDADVA